jgi:dynein heavy chain 2
VLRAYLRKYFNLLTINGQTEISQGLPIPKNQKELTTFISKQPDIDTPSLFGLPSNIDKVVQRSNSLTTISALKKLTAIMSDHAQLKKEDWLRIVGPITKSWEQIYRQVK